MRASEAAPYIPGCKVVIVTTGLVWGQKGQTHSTLNTHVENVDLLISEEAQQDMDLKSAFAPTVPRRAFFRLLLGGPQAESGWGGGRAKSAPHSSSKGSHWTQSSQYLVHAA